MALSSNRGKSAEVGICKIHINKNFTIFLLKSFNVLNLVKHSKRFRNFCFSDETEKVYQKLEEAIGFCKKFDRAEGLYNF